MIYMFYIFIYYSTNCETDFFDSSSFVKALKNCFYECERVGYIRRVNWVGCARIFLSCARTYMHIHI